MFIMLKNSDEPVCHMKSCQTNFNLLPMWGILQTLIKLGVCIIFKSRPEESYLEILMDEELNMTWQCALAAQKAKLYEVPLTQTLLWLYDNTTAVVCVGETTRISFIGLVLSWIIRQIFSWAQVCHHLKPTDRYRAYPAINEKINHKNKILP